MYQTVEAVETHAARQSMPRISYKVLEATYLDRASSTGISRDYIVRRRGSYLPVEVVLDY